VPGTATRISHWKIKINKGRELGEQPNKLTPKGGIVK